MFEWKNRKDWVKKVAVGLLSISLLASHSILAPINFVQADDDYEWDDDWDDWDDYDDDWDDYDDDWDDYDDDWDDYDDDWDDYDDDWDDYDDWDDWDDDDWDDDDWEDYYEDHYEALYGDDWEDAFERYYGVDFDDYIEAMYGDDDVIPMINWSDFHQQTQRILEANDDYQKDPKYEGIEPNITPDDDPNQGFESGMEREIGKHQDVNINEVGIRTDKPIPELAMVNKEQLYQKAKQEELKNIMEVDLNPQAENNSGNETQKVIPVKLNEKSVNDFNQTPQNIDINVLNAEFLALLNAERQAHGLEPVSYGAHLQEGTDKRGMDLASIGDIRVNNQPHVRLDGTSFREDFNYLANNGKQGLGENLAMVSYSGNPHSVVSEKALAEQFFNQWKNSPSHYQNMMSPDYKHSTVSVKMGQNNERTDGLTNSIVAVQILDTNLVQ